MSKKFIFVLFVILFHISIFSCKSPKAYISNPILLKELFSIADGVYARFTSGNLYSTVNDSNETLIGFEKNQYDFRTYNSFLKNDEQPEQKPRAVINGKEGFTLGEDRGFFSPIEVKTNFDVKKYASNLGILTDSEWKYLLEERDKADEKWGLASIKTDSDYVLGIVLLPDLWSCPQECSFNFKNDNGYRTNIYNIDEWEKLEKSGAVFLPNAGMYNNDDSKVDLNDTGVYLTLDISNYYVAVENDEAKCFVSSIEENKIDEYSDLNLFSVRLVERHRHTYSDKWSHNLTHHWHLATCSCGDLAEERSEHCFDDGWQVSTPATEEHTGSEYRQCLTCLYKETRVIPLKEHEHTFSDKYVYDNDYHWHQSTCGHNEISSKAPHFYNIDGVCSICKYSELANYLPSDTLSGIFSVDSNETKIKFAKGNLYYTGSKWSFEANQYDFRSIRKEGLSDMYSSSIINGRPVLTPKNNVGHFWWTRDMKKSYKDIYDDPDSSTTDILFTEDNVEGWSVLTKEEWKYLLGDSEERKNKWGIGAIATKPSQNEGYDVVIFGLFLLPDSWHLPNFPENTPQEYIDLFNFIPGVGNDKYNIYVSEIWEIMEESGAVFLPMAGKRYYKEEQNPSIYADGMGWRNISPDSEPIYSLASWYGGAFGCYHSSTPFSSSNSEDSNKYSWCIEMKFSNSDVSSESATFVQVDRVNGRDHQANSIRMVKRI